MCRRSPRRSTSPTAAKPARPAGPPRPTCSKAGASTRRGSPGSTILLCHRGGALVGSVHLADKGDGRGYLGMFVVRPDLQGHGIGRRFMVEAEATAHRLWGVDRMSMSVIALRGELIAYYERCGYRLTGERLPFPFDGLSTARVDGIELAAMEKTLPSPAD